MSVYSACIPKVLKHDTFYDTIVPTYINMRFSDMQIKTAGALGIFGGR